jgi:hypothetical protein
MEFARTIEKVAAQGEERATHDGIIVVEGDS